MIIQSLLGEFQHEAESTRKLLKAIPDSALNYKPQENLWTIGQLASHIAEMYNWFDSTFNLDVMEMSQYKYDKGDITKASNIVDKFNYCLCLNNLFIRVENFQSFHPIKPHLL